MTTGSTLVAEVGSPLAVAFGTRRVRNELTATVESTVADLAGALGCDRSAPLWIDGTCHRPATPLSDTGIVDGSTVTDVPPTLRATPCGPPTSMPVPTLRSVAGPAAGVSIALTPGRHMVGRSPVADMSLADPDLDPHALVVDVDDDGAVSVLQLTGRVPATVDSAPIAGPVALAPGRTIHVAATRLELLAPADGPSAVLAQRAAAGPDHTSPWRAPCLRGVRRSTPIEESTPGGELWARRRTDDDAFRVTLGWGPGEWSPVVVDGDDDAWNGPPATDDRPVTIDVEPDMSMAVIGDDLDTVAVARSIIIQLATATGPADWRLVVVTENSQRWAWCRWLPHLLEWHSPDGLRSDRPSATVGRAAQECHVLVVTDCAELVAASTDRRRALIDRWWPRAALIAISDPSPPAPSCRATLEIGSRFRARFTPEPAGSSRPIHAAGMADHDATSASIALAALDDPESPDAGISSLPGAAPVATLLGDTSPGDAQSIARRWRAVEHDTPRGVPVPIGVAARPIIVDLAGDGPHTLIAGATHDGTTGLLRSLIVALAASYPPDLLGLALIVSGATGLEACGVLPHTVGVVIDADEAAGRRVLNGLRAELRHRSHHHDTRPPLVVVVDDTDALAGRAPSFLAGLVSIARRGGPHGIHLVAATDCPTRTALAALADVADLRVAFRLERTEDAIAIVGHAAPLWFDAASTSEAMLHRRAGERVLFRAASCAQPEFDEFAGTIRSVAADRPPAAPRVWLEPLPAVVDGDDVDCRGVVGPVVGVVDIPEEQHRSVLSWSTRDGNLAVIGDAGAGTSTTLVTIVEATCARRRPDELHCYVVTADADSPVAILGALAHVREVVIAEDTARIRRLAHTLEVEIDRRRMTHPGESASSPDIVIVVDGDVAVPGLAEIVEHGPGVGVTTLIAGPPSAHSVTIAHCPQRWLFHLDDPADAALVGARPGDVPPPVPGRCCDLALRRFAQVVRPRQARPPDQLPSGRAAARTVATSAAGCQAATTSRSGGAGRFADFAPSPAVAQGGDLDAEGGAVEPHQTR